MGKLGQWFQVGANLGILLGLFFVGFQMRQDHQIAIASFQGDAYSSVNAFQASTMGENPARSYAKSITDPSSLTPEDVEVLRWYAYVNVAFLVRTAQLEKLGFAPVG